ncbi:hypothetical protein L249_8033 [Ophiocordyceps polyrhachis-furcata BCC 54312]|uniref:Uncharacterized protein n=1 Tax=Ophiocordyceps polyrhachis-furcata BCC 54312 TaxID=1330021 RepID=A0A367LHY4_9HYPO|nr:hypothetical protein L249_8033 [Ophiocordyceps polyrhachis-furcata BCC 54312]
MNKTAILQILSFLGRTSASHISPQEIINQARQYCGPYWNLETLWQRPPEACHAARFSHPTNKTCEYDQQAYGQLLDQECTLIGICSADFDKLGRDSTQETRSSIGFCLTNAFRRLQDVSCCQPPPLQGDPRDFDGSRNEPAESAAQALSKMSAFIQTICGDTSWTRPRRGCPVADSGFMSHVPACPADKAATYRGELKDACETWFDQRRKSIQWDQRSFSRIFLDVITFKSVPNEIAAWFRIKKAACCKSVVDDEDQKSKESPSAASPASHNLQQQRQKQHSVVNNNNNNNHNNNNHNNNNNNNNHNNNHNNNNNNNKGRSFQKIEWECSCHETGHERDARERRKRIGAGAGGAGAIIVPGMGGGGGGGGGEEVGAIIELLGEEVVIVDAIQPPVSGAAAGSFFGVLAKTAGGTYIWFHGIAAAFGTVQMAWKTADGIWLMVPTTASATASVQDQDEDQADGSSSIAASSDSSSPSSPSLSPSPSPSPIPSPVPSSGFGILLEGIEVEAEPKWNVSVTRPPTYDVHPWAMKIPEGRSG